MTGLLLAAALAAGGSGPFVATLEEEACPEGCLLALTPADGAPEALPAVVLPIGPGDRETRLAELRAGVYRVELSLPAGERCLSDLAVGAAGATISVPRPRSLALEGRVLDAQGRAAAAVRVRAFADAPADGWSCGETFVETLSRADGGFRLEGLDGRTGYQVVADRAGEGRGLDARSVSVGKRDVGTLVPQPPGRVTLRMRADDGAPIGCRGRLVGARERDRRLLAALSLPLARCDADGRLRVALPLPGRYVLELLPEDGLPVELALPPVPPGEERDLGAFDRREGDPLDVFVVGADARPLPDARVLASPAGGGLAVEARSDAAGRATLTALTPFEAHRIFVRAAGHHDAEPRLAWSFDGPLVVRLEAGTPSPARRGVRPSTADDDGRGWAVDVRIDGRLNPGVAVALLPVDGEGPAAHGRTDARGRARLPAPRAGLWLVSARSGRGIAHRIVDADGILEETLTLEILTRMLEVRVRSATAGATLSDARVRLERATPRPCRQRAIGVGEGEWLAGDCGTATAHTGRRGIAFLPADERGPWLLSVEHPAFHPWETRLELVGARTTVDAFLEPGRPEGRRLRLEVAGEREATVRVLAGLRSVQRETLGGRLEIDGLPPGAALVTVHLPGHGTLRRWLDLPEADDESRLDLTPPLGGTLVVPVADPEAAVPDVVDSDGAPWQTLLARISGGRAPLRHSGGETGLAWVFPDLPAGQYAVRLGGGEPRSFEVTAGATTVAW